MTPARLRLYHSMYQLFSFTMLLALHDQQHGHPVGGDGGGDALDGAAGERSTARRPASRRRGSTSSCAASASRRRCSARSCSTSPPRRCSAPAAARCCGPHLDAVQGASSSRPCMSLAFVFLLVGYGTKVGLVPLHNWLPDAHAEGPTPVSAVLSGLLLNVALYAVVRCKVLTDGALRAPLRRQPDDGLRPAVGGGRGVLPLAPARHQAHVRLLVDRAHGPHRPSPSAWAGRSRTSPGLLHMTVHSLTKSAIFFAVGHAAQKAGTQIMDDIRGLIQRQPDGRLGPDARHARDPRHAAVRRVRERVPDPHHRDARAALGDAVPAASRSASPSPRCSARCSRWCSARPRVQRAAASAGAACRCSCISRSVLHARPVHPALPRRLVSPGGAADRAEADDAIAELETRSSTACPARCRCGARSVERGAVARGCAGGRARRRAAGRALGERRARPRRRLRRARALLRAPTGSSGSSCRCRAARRYPDLSALFPARRAHAARRLRPARRRAPRARADRAPWLRHGAWPRGRLSAAPATSPPTRTLRAERATTIRSSASRATACTRFRSGPVHAGIIEPGHFRFSVVGEKVLRLEERLGYKHKGIEKRFEAHDARRGRAARRARVGRLDGGLRLGLRMARRIRGRRATPPRARAVAARAAARARAHRQPPRRPRLPRQRRRRSRSASRSSRGCKEDWLRANARAVRPPLPDGRASCRAASRATSTARRRRACCAQMRRSSKPRCARCARSTTSTPACRTASSTAGSVAPELAAQLGADRAGRRARAARPCDLRVRSRLRALRRARGRGWRRTATATSRRASRCASRRCSSRCGCIARDRSQRCPRATLRVAVPRAGRGRVRRRLGRGLARRGASSRSRPARGGRVRALPSARPVVAELAGARARGDRQHRSRLPADQQVVQPVATRAHDLLDCMLARSC